MEMDEMGYSVDGERGVEIADDNTTLIQRVFRGDDKARYGVGACSLFTGTMKGIPVMVKGRPSGKKHSLIHHAKVMEQYLSADQVMKEAAESDKKSDILTNYIAFEPTEIPHEWECVVLIRTKDLTRGILEYILDDLSYYTGITGYLFTNDLIADGEYQLFADIFVAVTEYKEGYRPAVWTIPTGGKEHSFMVASDDEYNGATLMSSDVNALFTAMSNTASGDPLIEDYAEFEFEKPGFGDPVYAAFNPKHLNFAGRHTNAYYMLPIAAALYVKMEERASFRENTFPRYLMGETEEYCVVVGEVKSSGESGGSYEESHTDYGNGNGSDQPDDPLQQLMWASKGALGE